MSAGIVSKVARFQRLGKPPRLPRSHATEVIVPGFYAPVDSTPEQRASVADLLARRGALDLAGMLGVEVSA